MTRLQPLQPVRRPKATNDAQQTCRTRSDDYYHYQVATGTGERLLTRLLRSTRSECDTWTMTNFDLGMKSCIIAII